jgi:membrane protease YdiL (CAAX protease family)
LIPRSKHAPPTAVEVAAVVILGASNVLLNRAVARPLQVPAALAASALLVLLARRSGATLSELGLAPDCGCRGVRAGLAAGIPIGAVAALGAFSPRTARFFRDERIVRTDAGEAAYELLIRIPLATAAAEELSFRGALEAILSRRRSPVSAALISSGLFGAWHILPALDRSLENPGVQRVHSGSVAKQATIVVSVCGVTAVSGLALSWLRARSGSIATPILVHYAANAGGFLGGWLAARRADYEGV